MADVCVVCDNLFERKKKGYKRRAVTTRLSSPRSFGFAFNKANPGQFFSGNNFICTNCWAILKTTQTKVTESPEIKKRKYSTSCETNDDAYEDEEIFPPPNTANHRAKKLLENYKYKECFRHLIKSSSAAKKALVSVACEIVKNEVKNIRKDSAFSQGVTVENISKFKWKTAIEEARQDLPATVSILESLAPSMAKVKSSRTKGRKGFKRPLNDKEAQAVLDREVGQLLATILFLKAPKQFKFVQSCVSVELWRQGVSHKVFETLNHMGVSLGIAAARNHVDKIGRAHDKSLLEWRDSLQAHIDGSKEGPTPNTYSFCLDNVQFSAETKHSTTNNSNKFQLLTMCFAVKDRIAINEISPNSNTAATSLDPFSFLPSPAVFDRLKSRMVFHVTAVLSEHLEFLSDLKTKIPQAVPHEHIKQMNEPSSKLVTIGTLDANPNSTSGMIVVFEHLQRYMVDGNSGVGSLVSGDGLSVERMLKAKRARLNGETSQQRLEDLWPCPQEFHKEVLLLQDSNHEFFKSSSLASRGTISQLKNDFNHRALKHDVMANFQHVWDMYEFATEGYIVLTAMKLCGLSSTNDMPPDFPSSSADQHAWLERLAYKVVDFSWNPPSSKDINLAATAYREPDNEEDITVVCNCGKESKGALVQCANLSCKTQWYHERCIKSTIPENEDWICCKDCEDSILYAYCWCNRKLENTEMVQCELAKDCRGWQWYHRKCAGLSPDENLPEKWYCSEACELGAEHDDHVLNHTKSLMWQGLLHTTRRGAVRSGNGPAMVDDWKIDLVQFWKAHPKYFNNAHYFLSCVAGFAPSHVRHSFIWNRVANPSGKPNGNIGLDLCNEHLNLEFKEMLKNARGNYTDREIGRCAQMSGPFGKQLDNMFTSAGIVDMRSHPTKKRSNAYLADIKRFVQEYQAEALCDYIPGRNHDGFEEYQQTNRIKSPTALGRKLFAKSQHLDMCKKAVI